MPRNRTSLCGFENPLGHHGLHSMTLRTKSELVSLLCRITKHWRSRRESNAHRGASGPRASALGKLGDARVMLPSETGSRPAGFDLLPRVTVSVAGIEPAAPSFQARMSTNDLHADGQSGWNRTSMILLPTQVDSHYPTL